MRIRLFKYRNASSSSVRARSVARWPDCSTRRARTLFSSRAVNTTPRLSGVTSGLVYGAAVGLGFAFTEDIAYLLAGVSESGIEVGALGFEPRTLRV